MDFLKHLLIQLFRAFVYREAARSLQKRSVLMYLKTLQMLRKALAGSIFLFLFLQLMFVGFIGTVVVAIMLLPQDLELRLWILFGVFGTFLVLPMICLMMLFSEKVWYQASGAEKMVNDLNSGV